MPEQKATYTDTAHSAMVRLECDTDINRLRTGASLQATVKKVWGDNFPYLKDRTLDFTVLISAAERGPCKGPYLKAG